MTFHVHSRRIAERIAELYLDRGLSDGQIALKFGFTRNQVSGIRRRNGIFRDLDQPDEARSDLTLERLTWFYGPERALRIANGRDRQTIADLAAWEQLGRRSAA